MIVKNLEKFWINWAAASQLAKIHSYKQIKFIQFLYLLYINLYLTREEKLFQAATTSNSCYYY